MGEHVISSLTLLTATVPVDTQGPTVRPEVHTSTVGLAYIYAVYGQVTTMPVLLLTNNFAVTCSPTCQNGGTCHISSSSAHCDCPSGYTGSYCQNRGMHIITRHNPRTAEVHEQMLKCTQLQYEIFSLGKVIQLS